MTAWGAWDATDTGRQSSRRGSPPVLDSGGDDVHSALVPPGALHQRVTAALANWQLDDAEELLADVERDPTPFEASPATAEGVVLDLGRAWADTLRADSSPLRLGYAKLPSPQWGEG